MKHAFDNHTIVKMLWKMGQPYLWNLFSCEHVETCLIQFLLQQWNIKRDRLMFILDNEKVVFL